MDALMGCSIMTNVSVNASNLFAPMQTAIVYCQRTIVVVILGKVVRVVLIARGGVVFRMIVFVIQEVR